ncbi:UDP-3-O-[3-hydroxymyristoyl] glucosamine N-acyltransferase, partial [hydrothermal vent metagenome]
MIGSITTQVLAQMLGGQLVGKPDLVLSDLGGIDEAGPGALTFIRSADYAHKWAQSNASAALVTRGIDIPGHDPDTRALLFVDNADQALVTLLAELSTMAAPPPPPAGIHPTAVVDDSATIDPTASIGPLCVIGPKTKIGPDCVLLSGVTLSHGVTIGARCTLHPGVVIYHGCTIGDDCLLHAGVTIGADGFGFIPHPAGTGLVKVPHLSTVVLGNHVEIGAGSCIDRGKFTPTTIGDGVKMDNLVQIGHNTRVGPHAVLCGLVGIGGSCTIGAGAMLGGQAGTRDNVHIGKGAKVAGKAGVMKDIPPGQVVFGMPARPGFDALR